MDILKKKSFPAHLIERGINRYKPSMNQQSHYVNLELSL